MAGAGRDAREGELLVLATEGELLVHATKGELLGPEAPERRRTPIAPERQGRGFLLRNMTLPISGSETKEGGFC